MTMLSILLASPVVPAPFVALVLAGLLSGVGLERWRQERPRFAPIFVRTRRPDTRRTGRHDHDA